MLPFILPSSPSVIFISTRDKAKIVKTVFEVQIQTLTVQLEVLLRNIFFNTFFLEISGVTIRSSSCEQLFLKDYTPKLLYQRPRNNLNIRRHLHMVCRKGSKVCLASLKRDSTIGTFRGMLQMFFSRQQIHQIPLFVRRVFFALSKLIIS